MRSKYKKIKQQTRLLVDEAINAVRAGFASEDKNLRPLELTQLEQRILMSASPLAVVAAAPEAVESSAPDVADVSATPSSNGPDTTSDFVGEDVSAIQSTVELVVIDPSADNHEQLVADLQSQEDRVFEILVLDPTNDGIAQITEALANLNDVSAIHLVSHGDEGEILLGTSVLSQRSIERYAAEMVTWQYSMTADADLLIYGCDLAASDDGIALTESLNLLLGTDVAASDDLTGHADLGGDWDLEIGVGVIETSIAFTDQLQASWTSVLTLNAYESFDYAAGSLDSANGGTGFASPWTRTAGTSADVISAGLTGPAGLPTAQGGSAQMGTLTTFSQSRDLNTTLGADGTTAWFSFLLRPDGTSGGLSFVIGDGDGATNTVNIGTAGSDFLVGADSTGTGSRISGAVVDGQTFFLAVKVDFAAGNDTVTLYLDPTTGVSAPDSLSGEIAVLTTADLGTFSQIGMLGGFAGNDSIIDEIRVGDSFTDVSGNLAPGTTILTATQDTYLNKDANDTNFGSSTSLIVDKSGGSLGDQRALFQFDVNTVPAGATITGATLQLNATNVTGSFDINAYELTEAWSEGSQSGTDGDASWDERTPGTAWATEGGTVNSTEVATYNANAVGTHSWDVTTLVQDWYSGAKTNNGLLLASTDSGGETVTYDSREGATVPRLVITYTEASAAVTAADDSYSTDIGTPLNIAAAGVLANDLQGPAPTAGNTLGHSAAADTNGDNIWNNGTTTSGFDWDFTGGGAVYTTTPTTALTNIPAAWVFDGTGGGIAAAFETIADDPTDDPASFELLFNPTDAVGQEIIFETGGSGQGTSLSLNGSVLELAVKKGSSIALATHDVGAEIAANEFIHVIAVVDNASTVPDVYLYVNGALVDTVMDVSGLTFWGNNGGSGLGTVNGTTNTTNVSNFEGEIAAFRLYESALPSTEIEVNYDSTAAAGSDVLTAVSLNTAATTGNVTLNTDGSFDYTPQTGFVGVDTFSYTATNGTNSDAATVSITVNPIANVDPVANAGGPYTITEGDSLSLDGSGSADADLDGLTYRWDLDNDGNFGEAGEPTGVSPTVTWATLSSFGVNDGGVYTIGLQVDDGKGGVNTTTALLTVTDVVDTTSDLLLHLTFDDGSGTTAADSSGNGNDGTLRANAEEGWTGGVVGSGAFYMNRSSGINEFFEVADSPTLQNVQEGSQYSLSAWFNPADVPTGVSPASNNHAYGILVKEGNHTGIWYDSSQRMNFEIWTGGSNFIVVESTNTFAPDQPYHVVATYNNVLGVAELYVNGVLEGTTAFTPGTAIPDYGTETWKIGTAQDTFANDSYAYPSTGVIDDVRIYGRSLGTSDVAALFALGDSGNRNPTANTGGPYSTSVGSSVTLDASSSTDLDADTLTYRWDLDNDGDFVEAGEPTGVNPTVSWGTLQAFGIDSIGTHTIAVRVEDGRGGVDLVTTTLTIVAGQPTADAGGPYAIAEGDTLTLDGSGSMDPNSDPLTYEWDLNYNGVTFVSDAAGESPDVTWSTLQSAGITDDGVYQVALRVTDGSNYSSIVQQSLTVTNTAPTLTVTGSATVTAGSSYVLNLGAVDPGDDSIANWIITWGDGSIQTVTGNPATVTHTYTNTGFTNNILVSATDEDGTHTSSILYATSAGTNQLFQVDATSGAVISTAGLVGIPVGAVIGPDGFLYTANFGANSIGRFDPVTGAFVDTFVHSGSEGLTAPTVIAFGADGSLFVSSQGTDEILRFGNDGRPLGTFVTAGSGGLDGPDGIAFGPNGNLYVASSGTGDILVYEGTTGAFVDTFASFGAATYTELHFRSNGNLLASSTADNLIREFDAAGNFVSDIVTSASGVTTVGGFRFGPDGRLYVSDSGDDRILRFEADGTYIDEFVSASAGLDQPYGVTFTPAVQVTVNAGVDVSGENYGLSEGGTLTQNTVAGWFNPSWKQRQQITIDSSATTSNLQNFSVLVKLHASSTDAINIDYSATQNFGQDLRFVDADGTVLSHEIESWDASGFSYVWVNVPQVYAGSTTDSFWMYYDHNEVPDGHNSNATWASHFTAVLHMNADAIDSSVNGNNGRITNVSRNDGISGGAGTFNGIDSQVNLGSDSTVDDLFVGGGTISATINPNSYGENGFGRIIDKAAGTFSGGANADGWSFQVGSSGADGFLIFEHGFTGEHGEWRTPPGSVNLNVWQNVAVAYDNSSAGNEPQIYIDGVLQTLTERKTPTGTARSDAALDLMIGNHSAAPTRTFEGQIDEVRLSKSTVTADQMEFYHSNLSGNLLASNGVENGPGGLLANDSDAEGAGLTVTLASGPSNAAAFTLNADGAFSYTHDGSETTSDSFTYTVSDGQSISSPVTVSLAIAPVNENSPVIADSQTFAVSETATVGTAIGTPTASDADSGTTLSNWTISAGNADGIFAINSSSGEISVANVADLSFDNSDRHILTLTVSDGTNTSATQTVTIDVIDENNQSPVVSAGQTFVVQENASTGTSLGSLLATDGDAGTVFSNWTITAGNDDGVFALDAASGQLTLADVSTLDFETQTSYSLSVTVTDGSNTSSVESVLVTINDIDEFNVSPVIDDNPTANRIAETSANGTTVGITASAFDADGSNNSIAYSLDNNANGRFSINGTTGVVTLADSSLVDFETATSHSITVRATSADSSWQTADFTIEVSDTNEFAIGAVSDSDGSANVVAENSAIGMVVGITAFATDPDASATVTYAFTVSPGNLFAIDSASGVVVTNAILDREVADNYSMTIEATSSDGSSESQIFTVSISDQNDNAPTITAGQSFNVSEFATNGDTVGDVASSDADATSAAANWTIVSGNSGGAFALNTSTGQITVADDSALDFETTDTYTLVVQADDGTNIPISGSVLINLTDEHDAPTVSTIADVVSDEDVVIGPVGFRVADVDSDVDSLVVTATSSDQSLVRDVDITISGTGADRFISLAPFKDATGGPATITVQVSDGTTVTSTSFTVSISPVNDAPSLSAVADQTINEDTRSGWIDFTVNDPDNDAADLIVTAISSDPSLIANSSIELSGTGENRSIRFTPEANVSGGPVTITLTVSDATVSSTQTFAVTILPVNDAPTMANIPDASTDEDTPIGPFTFRVGDQELASADLIVTATSSDQSIVGDGDIILGGTDEDRTISVNPNANAVGTVEITVTVSDGDTTSQQTFQLTVDPINDAPTISNVADVTIAEDVTSGPIAVTVRDIDDINNSLVLTVVSSNRDLIADGDVTVTGSGRNREIRFTPQENQFGGPVTLTLSVTDGEFVTQTSFDVIVTPVNDAPHMPTTTFTYQVKDNYRLNVTDPDLLENVTDAEGDSFVAVLASGPSHGTLNFNADGTFTYTGNTNHRGIDSFQFYTTDGVSNSVTATVRLKSPVVIPLPVTPVDQSSDQESSDVETENPVDQEQEEVSNDEDSDAILTAKGTAVQQEDANGDSEDEEYVPPPPSQNDDDDSEANGYSLAKVTDAANEFTFVNGSSIGSVEVDRVQNSQLGLDSNNSSTFDSLQHPATSSVNLSLFTTASYKDFADVKSAVEQVAQLRENLDTRIDMSRLATDAVATASMTVFATSVFTAVRTGVLALGFLTQLPVWTMFDPLMVMDGVSGDEGDSLEEIVDRNAKATADKAESAKQ